MATKETNKVKNEILKEFQETDTDGFWAKVSVEDRDFSRKVLDACLAEMQRERVQ